MPSKADGDEGEASDGDGGGQGDDGGQSSDQMLGG